jgi:hypothetical protein
MQIAINFDAMPHESVVLAGSLPIENLGLDLLVAEFGWSLKEASNLHHLAELTADHSLVTVLFSPRNLGLPWDRALRAVLDAAPRALPILCHGFADAIDWPEMADAGSFHSLLLPFNLREVRQSLEFVWDAICHPAAISVPRLRRLRKVVALDQDAGIAARAPRQRASLQVFDSIRRQG